MIFRKTIHYLREYFFPAGCGSCGTALLDAESSYNGLCEECRSFFLLYLSLIENCEICGKPLITEKKTCLSCRKSQESYKKEYSNKYFIRQIMLFPYSGRFKNVLKCYKFGKSLAIGNFFIKCLEKSLKDFRIGESLDVYSNTAWVPVPPRPGKIKKEGWDQLAFLSGLLSKSSQNIPVNHCLRRLKSKSQKELNKGEREKNLKGRIICVKEPPETAILFDDVITTGATLNACAQALLEKGTKNVYGVSLFYD